jgi:6-phosphofructokinase 1
MSKAIKRIAVFTSGGDAPGMNAAIRAVVRTATYYDLHVYGIMHGYEGMIKGSLRRLETQEVGNIIHRGGTMLKTARSENFKSEEGRKRAYDSLSANDIDACIAIGGNGTFTGASLFTKEYDIPFIGIPGTIDNDLYGTDYTIGFDTAVNTAIDAADKIRDTADSHSRLFYIEVMGRHSGFIALNTGIGSGAGSILVPENGKTGLQDVVTVLKKGALRDKLFNIVIVAEGNPTGGANEVAEKLKEVTSQYETKVTIIGHMQRGGAPTAFDRLLASRLGFSAVEGLLHGQENAMIGIVNNKIKFTSFEDAISKRKEIDREWLRMAEILSM